MGWLQKGGWRIGIRSEQGGYFYYAHLSEYAPRMEEGKTVEAGEMLGYMGDSGYGEEGTVGQFAVHLHFGIYIQTADGREVRVWKEILEVTVGKKEKLCYTGLTEEGR